MYCGRFYILLIVLFLSGCSSLFGVGQRGSASSQAVFEGLVGDHIYEQSCEDLLPGVRMFLSELNYEPVQKSGFYMEAHARQNGGQNMGQNGASYVVQLERYNEGLCMVEMYEKDVMRSSIQDGSSSGERRSLEMEFGLLQRLDPRAARDYERRAFGSGR